MASKKTKKKTMGGKKHDPDVARLREDKKISKEISGSANLRSNLLRDEVDDKIQKHSFDVGDSNTQGKSKVFYRNFVFRCLKCMEEFEHIHESNEPANIVVCPNCNHEHQIRIEQQGTVFEVEFPKSIKIVEDLSKK